MQELEKVLIFFNISYNKKTIVNTITASSFSNMKKDEIISGGNWVSIKNTKSNISFVRSGKHNKGADFLSKESVDKIVNRWGKLMIKFGYITKF